MPMINAETERRGRCRRSTYFTGWVGLEEERSVSLCLFPFRRFRLVIVGVDVDVDMDGT
jgi:hypothetical protein